MSDVVMEKTRDLGQAILESAAYNRMVTAESVMDGDEKACAIMQDYQEKRGKVQALMEAGDAGRDALMEASQVFRQAQESLGQNPYIAEYLEAREAFSGVIAQVNQVLQFIITGETGQNESSCAGGCDSCGHSGCGG